MSVDAAARVLAEYRGSCRQAGARRHQTHIVHASGAPGHHRHRSARRLRRRTDDRPIPSARSSGTRHPAGGHRRRNDRRRALSSRRSCRWSSASLPERTSRSPPRDPRARPRPVDADLPRRLRAGSSRSSTSPRTSSSGRPASNPSTTSTRAWSADELRRVIEESRQTGDRPTDLPPSSSTECSSSPTPTSNTR